ncbi:MAG: hypothetical protein Kow0031_05180 [Anaerolineae bacterium]
MTRKKLIEVALPLEAINEASAREKSIRHGHPSTLHLWWARRPLAAARAVIFASLVDDPGHHPEDQTADVIARSAATTQSPTPHAETASPAARSDMAAGVIASEAQQSPTPHAETASPAARSDMSSRGSAATAPLSAPPEFIAACRKLPKGKNAEGLDEKGRSNDTPRMRLFDFIERLVLWESTTDERVLATARELIRLSTGGNPPPLLDPFAGGGSIPLEAQRLGLEAHASDLNPVAVMINKALIEIPPRFANRSPVNPRDRAGTAGSGGWKGAAGLAADVRYYGEWMRDRAFERIGHLYPDYVIASEAKQSPATGAETATPAARSDMSGDVIARSAATTQSPTPHPETASATPRSDMSSDVIARAKGSKQSPAANAETASAAPRSDMSSDVIARAKGSKQSPAANAETASAAPRSDMRSETVIAWLWARTVRCPNPACGAMMPLVRSFELSKKKGRRAWVVPQVDPHTRKITFEVNSGKGTPPDGTVNRLGGTCIACETPVPFDHIRAEGRAGRMVAQLMAIVTEGNSGRSYYSPDKYHVEIANQAKPEWKPDHPLPHNPRDFKTPNYGMKTFADLFTPRQLTALTTFSDLVAEARQQIEADALAAGLPADSTPLRDDGSGAKAYAEAVSVYLAFAIGRLSNRLATITVWNTGGEKIEQVFARQAIPMTWDFPEANPFSDSTGNWLGNMNWIGKSLESLPYSQQIGSSNQTDATQLDRGISTAISTDPPYYDNIGYADLSDYFYIWMRSSLRDVYSEIFGTMLVPKTPELIASPYRYGGDKTAAEKHFETGLMQAFAKMRRVILPEYPLTVYYAFKQQEVVIEEGTASTGWETMLTGLIETGFQIVGTWPMRTERNTGIKASVNALASSIVLVCRPRPADAPLTSRREFVNALRRELPTALKEMQSGNIAPVDLAQASIGPGMAVYSRYSKVLEPDGSRLTVRAALQLINHELDAYLAEQEGALDADSRFAVAWFEQFGFKEGGFGQADVLARAKNTSVDGLRNAGVLEAGAGKVRLIPWEELDPEWDPASDRRLTVWEATHHLIERLNHHGEQGAAMLLAKMAPDLAAEARQLAYRLYSICERKSWADHARDYNALVISWSASQEQAVKVREQYRQGSLFE